MKILVNRTLRIKPSDNVMNYSKNSVIRFPFQNAMISSVVELQGFVFAGSLLVKKLANHGIRHLISSSVKNKQWQINL